MSGSLTVKLFQSQSLWFKCYIWFWPWIYRLIFLKSSIVGIQIDISNVKWIISPGFCWFKLVCFPFRPYLENEYEKIYGAQNYTIKEDIEVLKLTVFGRFDTQ